MYYEPVTPYGLQCCNFSCHFNWKRAARRDM